MKKQRKQKKLPKELDKFQPGWIRKTEEMKCQKNNFKLWWQTLMKLAIFSDNLIRELPSIPNWTTFFPKLTQKSKDLSVPEKFKPKKLSKCLVVVEEVDLVAPIFQACIQTNSLNKGLDFMYHRLCILMDLNRQTKETKEIKVQTWETCYIICWARSQTSTLTYLVEMIRSTNLAINDSS